RRAFRLGDDRGTDGADQSVRHIPEHDTRAVDRHHGMVEGELRVKRGRRRPVLSTHIDRTMGLVTGLGGGNDKVRKLHVGGLKRA
ncbi:MAG: hypothetical protein ACXVI8_07025, partial [Halobacteriota archaeon]